MQRNDFNLYILKDGETISSPECNKLPLNTIILYPNPDDNGLECSTGDRRYKARFRIADEKNNVTEVIDALMEKSMKFTKKGFISKRTQNYAVIVTNALKSINEALVGMNKEVPQLIKDRLAVKNMQDMLADNDKPRFEHACELKQKAEEEQRKQAENVANETLIFHLATNGVTEPEVKVNTEENKQPAKNSSKVHQSTGHHPYAEETEVVPYVFPSVLEELILEQIGEKKEGGWDVPNMPTAPQCARLTLFGRPYLDMQKTEEMTRLGSMVLRGEENDVEMVLDEVRKNQKNQDTRNPALLDIVITVTDPLGTPVTGTLLQLAAMVGDVNLKPNMTNEKDRGLLERLITAGNIPAEKVVEQLQCINSEEAKRENNARVQRYLTIIKKFGNSLCEGNITNDEAIAQLEKELLEERRKAVNAGFIFDPKILHDTAQWFEENVNRFGDHWNPKSDVFWVNGFGKSQSLLSSRDAQVVKTGIGCVVDEDKVPARSLKNPSGESYFYNVLSGLGWRFYLGYSEELDASIGLPLHKSFGKLMSSKNSSIMQACALPKPAFAD